MIEHIIIFALSLVSIDLYYIIYKAYKKVWLKRINFSEKQRGLTEEDYTTYEEVSSNVPIIVYGLSALCVSFYMNFINNNYLEGSFFEKLITNFEAIILPLLIFLSFSVIWKYIKGVFDFFSGFRASLVKNNVNEIDVENIEENDVENENFEEYLEDIEESSSDENIE